MRVEGSERVSADSPDNSPDDSAVINSPREGRFEQSRPIAAQDHRIQAPFLVCRALLLQLLVDATALRLPHLRLLQLGEPVDQEPEDDGQGDGKLDVQDGNRFRVRGIPPGGTNTRQQDQNDERVGPGNRVSASASENKRVARSARWPESSHIYTHQFPHPCWVKVNAIV